MLFGHVLDLGLRENWEKTLRSSNIRHALLYPAYTTLWVY